jgi:hypothetical protein
LPSVLSSARTTRRLPVDETSWPRLAEVKTAPTSNRANPTTRYVLAILFFIVKASFNQSRISYFILDESVIDLKHMPIAK